MNRRGRADTPEDKRQLLQRLLNAWEKYPQLRLGQLIDNSMCFAPSSLFHIEDEPLLVRIEACIERSRPRPSDWSERAAYCPVCDGEGCTKCLGESK